MNNNEWFCVLRDVWAVTVHNGPLHRSSFSMNDDVSDIMYDIATKICVALSLQLLSSTDSDTVDTTFVLRRLLVMRSNDSSRLKVCNGTKLIDDSTINLMVSFCPALLLDNALKSAIDAVFQLGGKLVSMPNLLLERYLPVQEKPSQSSLCTNEDGVSLQIGNDAHHAKPSVVQSSVHVSQSDAEPSISIPPTADVPDTVSSQGQFNVIK